MLVSRIPIVQYLSAFLFRAGIDNIKLTRCIATTPSLNPAKTTNGSLYIKLHNIIDEKFQTGIDPNNFSHSQLCSYR